MNHRHLKKGSTVFQNRSKYYIFYKNMQNVYYIFFIIYVVS